MSSAIGHLARLHERVELPGGDLGTRSSSVRETSEWPAAFVQEVSCNMPTTTITFRILAPLYGLNRAGVIVPTAKGDVAIRFMIVGSPNAMWKTEGGPTVTGDEFGILHNTLITTEFPARVEVISPESGEYSEAQVAAVALLNVVIGHYRMAARIPQIRTIPTHHAGGFRFSHTDESGTAVTGLVLSGLDPDGTDAGVAAGDKVIVDLVQAGVRRGQLPVWLSLLLDAHAELDAQDIRSALAHLYMSCEMLTGLTCRRVGLIKAGIEKTDAFLDPHGPGGQPPGISVIMKQTRDWWGKGPSKTKLAKELGRAWRNRNDVMHGKQVDISRSTANKAFKSFRVLQIWMDGILNDLDKGASFDKTST